MHKTLFEKIRKKYTLTPVTDVSVTTFSNTPIKILGNCNFEIKFTVNNPGIYINFLIIDDILNTPVLLLGNNVLREGMGTISYEGPTSSPSPMLAFKHPVYVEARVHYISPLDCNTFSTYVELAANETADIEVTLSPGFKGVHTDIILCTSSTFHSVMVIPSRTDITYDKYLDTWTGTARITNIGSTKYSGILTGNIEIINKLATKNIENCSDTELKTLFVQYPCAHEVLPSLPLPLPIPTLTIYSLATMQKTDIVLEEGEVESFLTRRPDPTYEGEAIIDSKLLEAGLEIPTFRPM
jgi:hypothetical protein